MIQELASIFDKTVRPNGIVLHRSGDEFIILYPADFPDQALLLVYSIMKNISDSNFNVGQLQVGASSGIARLENIDKQTSFNVLEERAEQAVKPKGEVKNRGKATFELIGSAAKVPMEEKSSRDRAFCIMKSGITSPRPFNSPWLNMLSLQLSESLAVNGELARVRSTVDQLVGWMQPDLVGQMIRSALENSEPSDCSRKLSPFDLAIAVAHGVFRGCLQTNKYQFAKNTLLIRFSQNHQTCELCIGPGNEILAHFGEKEDGLSELLDLGSFWSSSTDYPDDLGVSPLALLVKIGHFELGLPKSLFAEIMVLDDRPTMGGGLPDFWEATIARLIAHTEANPNVAVVFVLGEHKYAKHTIQKLKEIDSWASQAEQISYKTGMRTESIRGTAERLRGKIFFPKNEDELLQHIKDVLKHPQILQTTSMAAAPQECLRLLHRDLRMNGMALGTSDGCRVKTIAEAYPVVLEIARKVDEEATIKDQAGQENLELIDFKVHLTNPTKNLVPAFYEKEAELLEQYFKEQFLSESGLFAKRFKENNQLEAVLQHVVEAIKNRHKAFATRRAIIIVPHMIQERKDLTPLGLVSIRVIPRFLNNNIQLHYSFTWRTVEALVGFPYSLYSSVRFSQHFTEEVKKLLTEDYQRQVTIGEVSYIAHSLHIYKDDYGQNIARRIVNDASR